MEIAGVVAARTYKTSDFSRQLAFVAAVLLCISLVGGGPLGLPNAAQWRSAAHALIPHGPSGVTTSRLSSAARTTGSTDRIDAANVVERVAHHIDADATRRGVLTATDAAYSVEFDPSGFALRPHGSAIASQWSLETIERGTSVVRVEPHAWTSTENVARRTATSYATESVTTRDGQVEWDLVLAHRPAGNGDLVVRSEISHADIVRIGAVQVRDAANHVVWRSPTSVVDGQIAIRVPASIVEHARYPLTIDPTVGPETFVSPTASTNGPHNSPAIGFDGTNYLVVWTNGNPGTVTGDIWGARVSPSGTILDANGFAINTNTSVQSTPAVAFDGTNYLVTWIGSSNSNLNDIDGARVTKAGVVLDASGFTISGAANTQNNPQVAFDGTNYLVVWADNRNGNTNGDIYGARVTKAGVVLDPNGIPISTAPNTQSGPALAFDGTNYLVVWADFRTSGSGDIYGAQVTTGGGVIQPNGIAISAPTTGQTNPAVAFDGTNFLVAWQDDRSGTDTDIWGARVNKSGSVLDASGVRLTSAPSDQFDPRVGFDGTNYLVIAHDDRTDDFDDVWGVHISKTLTVVGPSEFAIATGTATANLDKGLPALAFDGTNFLVAWADGRYGSQIAATRVTKSGKLIEASPFVVTTRSNTQDEEAFAFDGTNYLVVWVDTRNGGDDIYGARLTTGGLLLDPNGFPISTATGNQIHPSVAFDGTNYLVTWSDARSGTFDIYGTRVDKTGTVLDASGFAISTAAGVQDDSALAFDGTNYLVTWDDARSGTSNDIYAARVSTFGGVLDPSGIAISTTTNTQRAPAVAFDGTNYTIVWYETQPTTGFDIYGARVSKAGVLLSPGKFVVSAATGDQTFPAIAFDGTNYLAVWADHRSGTTDDVYGARINKSGAVLDASGIPISTAPNDQQYPSVAFNGQYLVAWDDRRSGVEAVFAARIATDGTVQDTSGYSIASGTWDMASVRVATTPGATKWRTLYQKTGTFGAGVFSSTSPK